MPVAFGEDAAGELFVVDYMGEVFKLVPDGVPPQSCCRADFDGDGGLDLAVASADDGGEIVVLGRSGEVRQRFSVGEPVTDMAAGDV